MWELPILIVYNRPVVDIDDDWLEPTWGTSVAAKLDALGDDGFIDAEGHALMYGCSQCLTNFYTKI
jgi:hypothetical protein